MRDESGSTPLPARLHRALKQLKVRPIVQWLTLVLIVAAGGVSLLTRMHSADQAIARAPTHSAIGLHTGETAPDFVITPLTNASKQPLRLHDLRGHVVVINFWSPSCAPCGEEAPVLVKVSRAYEARGVQFLGIAFDGSTDDMLNFVHQYEIPFPIATDDGNVVAVAYGLVAIPVTVVVNGAGIIDMVIQGTVLQTNLESGIQTALHAQPHDR